MSGEKERRQKREYRRQKIEKRIQNSEFRRRKIEDRKKVTVHASYRLLSFALSGLKMFVRFVTQGVALG